MALFVFAGCSKNSFSDDLGNSSHQPQTLGAVTLKLQEVSATIAIFTGNIDMALLDAEDNILGGMGIIYTTADKTLDIETADIIWISSIDSNNQFRYTADNLLFNTEYHYKLFVYKNGLYQYGKEMNFKTNDIIVEVVPSDLGFTQILFSGRVSGLNQEDSGIEIGMYQGHSIATAIEYSTPLIADISNKYTFDILFTNLKYGQKYTFFYYIKQNDKYKFGEYIDVSAQNPYSKDLDIASAIDLACDGASNCYVVSEPGVYKIPVVKGNGDTPVEDVSAADVVWESFGTSKSPEYADLISGIQYADDYIYFEVASPFKEGNAVIAACIEFGGSICWSWHIWLVKDVIKEQIYANNAGVLMDRNLGAISEIPGSVGSLGLFYQWGRKDPFIGASSINGNLGKSASTVSWHGVESEYNTGTISYAVAHPTTFIYANEYNGDWLYYNYADCEETDNTRWQTKKTIYDPCPAGWRVPDSNVWKKSSGLSSYLWDYEWDENNLGLYYTYLTVQPSWYPFAGLLSINGNISEVGTSGYYWSCDQNKDALSVNGLEIGESFMSPVGTLWMAWGCSVRCQKE